MTGAGRLLGARHAADHPDFCRSARCRRRASCGTDSTARSGCPASGVDGGTSSPRITSEAGPTVAPGADPRGGQRDAVRAERRAVLQHHGVHPHDAVMEQVGLHHAPAVDGGAVAQRHQVGLGQPVRLAPHAAADLRAQRPQPQVHHRRAAGGAGEPRRGNRLDERVGHLVAPHERRPQRMLDRRDPADHTATSPRTAMPPATAPATSRTTPPSSAAHR